MVHHAVGCSTICAAAGVQPSREKIKLGVREKNDKGERKITLKKGGKALKCIFLGFKLKNPPDATQT